MRRCVLLATLVSSMWVSYPAVAAEPLTFSQFPATASISGTPAMPNLASHPSARRYRTALRLAAKQGPNFAGAFTFVQIGCGTGCQQIAVIDARNGSVYFPKGLPQVDWAGWWHEPYGAQFRRDSRLVIVYGQAGGEDAPSGVSYFEWGGTEFKLLRFEPQDPGSPPK